jgi:hypothetical protein
MEMAKQNCLSSGKLNSVVDACLNRLTGIHSQVLDVRRPSWNF